MATANELRSQAKECLKLANETKEVFVRAALTELADKFNRDARQAERRARDMVASHGLHVHAQ